MRRSKFAGLVNKASAIVRERGRVSVPTLAFLLGVSPSTAYHIARVLSEFFPDIEKQGRELTVDEATYINELLKESMKKEKNGQKGQEGEQDGGDHNKEGK